MKVLIACLFRVLAWIPDTAAITLSRWIAAVLIGLRAEVARVSEINLGHCFPELNDLDRKQLLHRSLAHASLLIFEFAYLQHRNISKLLDQIIAVRGPSSYKRLGSRVMACCCLCRTLAVGSFSASTWGTDTASLRFMLRRTYLRWKTRC